MTRRGRALHTPDPTKAHVTEPKATVPDGCDIEPDAVARLAASNTEAAS